MEKKYNVTIAENEILSQETYDLQHKELRNTRKGEKALAIINESPKVKKDVILFGYRGIPDRR